MRLLLIIVGAFAAMACVEKSATAQNGPWCINKPDTPPQCRYTTLEQCLADRLGKVPLVIRTACGNHTPEAVRLWQRLRQFNDIRRDPPCLVRLDFNQSSG
jgi:uncharacterized protein DUF3551